MTERKTIEPFYGSSGWKTDRSANADVSSSSETSPAGITTTRPSNLHICDGYNYMEMLGLGVGANNSTLWCTIWGVDRCHAPQQNGTEVYIINQLAQVVFTMSTTLLGNVDTSVREMLGWPSTTNCVGDGITAIDETTGFRSNSLQMVEVGAIDNVLTTVTAAPMPHGSFSPGGDTQPSRVILPIWGCYGIVTQYLNTGSATGGNGMFNFISTKRAIN